ncbi:uncharacterized protein LY89DRAFT_432895 [Mollisia scopiformis]|uniref:Uncharacterized protein n=1 Tax=Mollisia scopiformis TaxID=149040 RepID=A0A194XMT3_MOLSC|nr:uncharacterized protein LY89DRAFT_432895 [Mollisia scopiformis]KUJ21399.1 hypothetical protein LY89DRAFT_432895 [Mollisia scopiformis]
MQSWISPTYACFLSQRQRGKRPIADFLAKLSLWHSEQLSNSIMITFSNGRFPYSFRSWNTFNWQKMKVLDVESFGSMLGRWLVILIVSAINSYSRLATCPPAHTSFISRCRAIQIMNKFMVDGKWAWGQLKDAVANLDLETAQEGRYLAKLANLCSKDVLISTLIPSLAKHAANLPMTMAFFANTSVLTNFKDGITDIMHAALSRIQISPRNEASGLSRNQSTCAQLNGVESHFHDVITTLSLAYKHGVLTQLDQGIAKLEKEVGGASSKVLGTIYIPFLAYFTTKVEEAYLNTYIPMQRLYRTILNAYIKRNITPEPQPPENLARESRGCGCFDCITLDVFLTHPTMTSFEFKISTKRRRHLKHRLQKDIAARSINTTIQCASPHSLMVEKATKYDDDLNRWKQLREEWKAKIRTIDANTLKKVLGKADFDLITALKPISAEPNPTQPAKFEPFNETKLATKDQSSSNAPLKIRSTTSARSLSACTTVPVVEIPVPRPNSTKRVSDAEDQYGRSVKRPRPQSGPSGL